MAATVYRDPNFEGVFARLGPGLYSGRDLMGCPHQSTSCEEIDNAISSMRVDPNVVVAFADSHAITASGGGSRVAIGPAEFSDLAAFGMGDRVSSVLVVPFRSYDSALPAPDGGVTLFGSHSLSGRRSELRRGDYTKARLATEEVRMPGGATVSLSVAAHVIAILYAGDNFEMTSDAVMVAGPAVVEDVERLGMSGRVNSVRVLYGDPFDAPALGRPRPPPVEVGLVGRIWLEGEIGPPGETRGPGKTRGPSEAGGLGETGPPPRASARDWRALMLIVLFIAIVATAAYLSGKTAKTAAKREVAEANLVAQVGAPLAAAALLA